MTDTPDPKLDSITVLEEHIATLPDGSPLAPKLLDVIEEIKRLRGLAGAAAKSVHEPSHREIKETVHAKPKDEPGIGGTKPSGSSKR